MFRDFTRPVTAAAAEPTPAAEANLTPTPSTSTTASATLSSAVAATAAAEPTPALPTVPITWSAWGNWSSCVTGVFMCGQGVRTKQRHALNAAAASNDTQTDSCHTPCTGPMKQCWSSINLRGFVVTNHVVVSQAVPSSTECCRLCSIAGNNCKSITFGERETLPNGIVQHECILNSITKEKSMCTSDFQTDSRYFHYGVDD